MTLTHYTPHNLAAIQRLVGFSLSKINFFLNDYKITLTGLFDNDYHL